LQEGLSSSKIGGKKDVLCEHSAAPREGKGHSTRREDNKKKKGKTTSQGKGKEALSADKRGGGRTSPVAEGRVKEKVVRKKKTLQRTAAPKRKAASSCRKHLAG